MSTPQQTSLQSQPLCHIHKSSYQIEAQPRQSEQSTSALPLVYTCTVKLRHDKAQAVPPQQAGSLSTTGAPLSSVNHPTTAVGQVG